MNNYYVLRLGSVFRIIYMDADAVPGWSHGGWELRAYATNAEAQSGLEKWKASLTQKRAISRLSSLETSNRSPRPSALRPK